MNVCDWPLRWKKRQIMGRGEEGNGATAPLPPPSVPLVITIIAMYSCWWWKPNILLTYKNSADHFGCTFYPKFCPPPKKKKKIHVGACSDCVNISMHLNIPALNAMRTLTFSKPFCAVNDNSDNKRPPYLVVVWFVIIVVVCEELPLRVRDGLAIKDTERERKYGSHLTTIH